MALMQMNKISVDEDDDDLESLRTAALQSLQKKAVTTHFDLVAPKPKEYVQQNKYSPTHRRGRGGFHQNNRGRNGMFNNPRARNPNLISIPTEAEASTPTIDPPKGKHAFSTEKDTFKLTLPQDRYCNKPVEKEAKEKVSSKFSRYDDSDESESESEEEEESEKSDSESTGLHKAGSLEALMEELENEIKGKSSVPTTEPAPIKAPKVKRRNKRLRTRTDSNTAENDILNTSLDTEPINSPEHPTLDVDLSPKHNDKDNKDPQTDKVQIAAKLTGGEEERSLTHHKPSPPRTTMRNRSPPPRKLPNGPPYRPNRNLSPPRQPRPTHYNTISTPFNPFHTQQQFAPFVQPSYNNAPFPPFPLDLIHQQPPPYLPRPLSPLAINTEALCTITKAPLSPRSAAFVLQNREIIAQRRRKSPKRPFSRSPSPRRSLSPLPRRSLSKSPLRNRGRSRSPPRRLSPPSRGGRNNSPPRRRRSMSPGNSRRTNIRKKRSPPQSSKLSIRDRLGVRGRDKVDATEDKADDEPPTEDPILEARKRKFERTEINVKEGGVIKLKKEEDQQPEAEPATKTTTELTDLDEEALLLEDDALSDTKLNDIFSDEQSDDDQNEGRFKTSVNGTPTSDEPSRKPERKRRRGSPSHRATDNGADERKTATPAKQRIIRTASKQTKKAAPLPPRVTSPIESKKIEIKIRNPAKYEERTSRSKYDVATEDETRQTDEIKQRGKKERRVDTEAGGDEGEGSVAAGQIVQDAVDAELETAEDSNVDSKCSDGGDLRAQLSRKRAERQNKFPIAEAIQTRLLQSAIKDAVFKKVKKSKKSKHRSSALKDGKLPIHLRLGLSGSELEIYTEHRKKSKKSKHRSADQV